MSWRDRLRPASLLHVSTSTLPGRDLPIYPAVSPSPPSSPPPQASVRGPCISLGTCFHWLAHAPAFGHSGSPLKPQLRHCLPDPCKEASSSFFLWAPQVPPASPTAAGSNVSLSLCHSASLKALENRAGILAPVKPHLSPVSHTESSVGTCGVVLTS